MSNKIDRRSLLGSDEKEETSTTPEPAIEAAEEPPTPTQEVQPLDGGFMRRVADQWPLTPQGRGLSQNLPQALVEMLERQSDDFLQGFANGAQCIHDLCIKVLMNELHSRVVQMQQAQLQAGTPVTDDMLTTQDKIVTVTATQVEGLLYMACRVLVDREDACKNSN